MFGQDQIRRLVATLRVVATKNTVKNITILLSASGIGQIVAFLASPLIARLYSPSELGSFALFVAALAILGSFATARFDVASVLPARDDDALGLMLLGALSCASLALIVFLILLIFRNQVATNFNHHSSTEYFLILPICLIGIGGFQILSFWGIRKKQFAMISTARLWQTLATVICQIGLGFCKIGPLGLAAGDAIGRIAGVRRLAASVSDACRNLEVRSLRRHHLFSLLRRYRRFPLYSVPPSLLNVAAQQSPNLAIATIFGTTPLGLYAMAERLVGVPLSILGNAISQVFLSEAVDAERVSPSALARRAAIFSAILICLGVTLVVPFAYFAPRIFAFALGARWLEAGYFVQALSPMLICQFAFGPIGSVLDVLERQDLHLLRELCRAALVGFGIWLISTTDKIAAIDAASILGNLMALGYVCGALLIFAALRAHIEAGRGSK